MDEVRRLEEKAEEKRAELRQLLTPKVVNEFTPEQVANLIEIIENRIAEIKKDGDKIDLPEKSNKQKTNELPDPNTGASKQIDKINEISKQYYKK